MTKHKDLYLPNYVLRFEIHRIVRFYTTGEGGGADLGLVKGGFKSENQNNFSHTHYWFNTPLYSSQQQRGKHKIYIPYFICIIQKHNC